ncbi:MAG: putative nucleic acid-binding protein [Gammaproteobacteria bacterium]|jgi:predicted nucleic acid-binding protein
MARLDLTVGRRLRYRVGPGAVVSDTTTLITLARIGHLDLLRELYEAVVIPRAVHQELALDSKRAGVDSLEQALQEGWLVVHEVFSARSEAQLLMTLGSGEAQAIALAEQLDARTLLLDDELAREVAATRELPLVRTLEIFVYAKARGLLAEVRSTLLQCERTGYRISPELLAATLLAAGEAHG